MATLKKASIGSISEGTLRTDDLIEASLSCLEDLDPEAAEQMVEAMDKDDADPDEILDELRELLEDHAPDLCYFGMMEGDGACYGFWPCEMQIRDSIHDKETLAVEDLPSYILHTSDHGNQTLYKVTLEEIW